MKNSVTASNTGAREVECLKGISLENTARMNRGYECYYYCRIIKTNVKSPSFGGHFFIQSQII